MQPNEESKEFKSYDQKKVSNGSSDKTPKGSDSSNDLSNTAKSKPHVSFSPLDRSPQKDRPESTLKRRNSLTKQSKKRKYLDLEDELMQARYMLFYADDIVQGGLHAKSEFRFNQLQGEKEQAVLADLRLKEGIFFDFNVSPSQKKQNKHFSKLALVPFREDPFKDSSSYTRTPIKISSKLSNSSIRSRTSKKERVSPNFQNDELSVRSTTNPKKAQHTLPLRNKDFGLLTAGDQIEEEVLIDDYSEDSFSNRAGELRSQQQQSGSSDNVRMKQAFAGLAEYVAPTMNDIMKKKRLDEIEKLSPSSKKGQIKRRQTQMTRKDSLKIIGRYTVNKDAWKLAHPEIAMKEALSKTVKRKQTLGAKGFAFKMKAVKEISDSFDSPHDDSKKLVKNESSSSDDRDLSVRSCGVDSREKLSESESLDSQMQPQAGDPNEISFTKQKRKKNKEGKESQPKSSEAHANNVSKPGSVSSGSSVKKSRSLSSGSIGIGNDIKVTPIEPTSACIIRRSSSIHERVGGKSTLFFNHNVSSLQIDMKLAKRGQDFSEIRGKEKSTLPAYANSAASNQSVSGTDSSAVSSESAEMIALKKLTTLHQRKKCVGRRHQEMRDNLNPSLQYAHGEKKNPSSASVEQVLQEDEPKTPVTALLKRKTFKELSKDMDYTSKRSKSFIGIRESNIDEISRISTHRRQNMLGLKHIATEMPPSFGLQESKIRSMVVQGPQSSLMAQKYDSVFIRKQRRKFCNKLRKCAATWKKVNDCPRPRYTLEEEEDMIYMKKQKKSMKYLKNLAKQRLTGGNQDQNNAMASETPDDATTFERPSKLNAPDIQMTSDMQSQNPFKGSVKVLDSNGELTPSCRQNTSGSILATASNPRETKTKVLSEQKVIRDRVSSNRQVSAFENDEMIKMSTRLNHIRAQSTEVNQFLVKPGRGNSSNQLANKAKDSYNSSNDVTDSQPSRLDTKQSLSLPEGPEYTYQLNVPAVDFSAYQGSSKNSAETGKTNQSQQTNAQGKRQSQDSFDPSVQQWKGRPRLVHREQLPPKFEINLKDQENEMEDEERKQNRRTFMLNEPSLEWQPQPAMQEREVEIPRNQIAFSLEPTTIIEDPSEATSPDFQIRPDRRLRANPHHLTNIMENQEEDSKSQNGDRSQDAPMDVESNKKHEVRPMNFAPQRRMSPPRMYMLPLHELERQHRNQEQQEQNSGRMLGSDDDDEHFRLGQDRLPDDLIIESSDSEDSKRYHNLRRNLRSTNVSPAHSSTADQHEANQANNKIHSFQLKKDLSKTLKMNKINNPLRANSGKELVQFSGTQNLHKQLAQTIKAKKKRQEFDFNVMQREIIQEEEKRPLPPPSSAFQTSIPSGRTNEAGLQPSVSCVESEFSFKKPRRHSVTRKRQTSEKKFEIGVRRMDTFQPLQTNSSVDKKKEEIISGSNDSLQQKKSLASKGEYQGVNQQEEREFLLKSGPAFKGDYFDASPASQRNVKKQRSSIQLSLHLCEKSRGSSLHVNSERNKSPPPEMQAVDTKHNESSSMQKGSIFQMAESPEALNTDQNSTISPAPTDSISEVKSRQREENASSLRNHPIFEGLRQEDVRLDESLQRIKNLEPPPEVSKQTTFGTIVGGQPYPKQNYVNDRAMNRISLGVSLQPHKKISTTILNVSNQQSLNPKIQDRFSILAKPVEDRSQRLGIVENDLDQLANMMFKKSNKKKKKKVKLEPNNTIIEENESVAASYFSRGTHGRKKSNTFKSPNRLQPPKSYMRDFGVFSEGKKASRKGSPIIEQDSPRAMSITKLPSSADKAQRKRNVQRRDSISNYSQSKKFGLTDFFDKKYVKTMPKGQASRVLSPNNLLVGKHKSSDSPVSVNIYNQKRGPMLEVNRKPMLVGSHDIVKSEVQSVQVRTSKERRDIRPFLAEPKERHIDVSNLDSSAMDKSDNPFSQADSPKQIDNVDLPLGRNFDKEDQRYSLISETYQQKSKKLEKEDSINKFRRRKDLKIEIAGSQENPKIKNNLK